MNSSGYIKSYRSTFDHWVAEDPKTYMAWQEIIHFAAYADFTTEVSGQVIRLQRGQVNISKLKSRKHFTEKQWRRFIEQLVECRMIARSAVHQLGRGNGSIAVYDVLSYDKFQSNTEGTSNGTSKGMSNGASKGEPKERAEQAFLEDEGGPNGDPKGGSKGTSKGSPYIKEFQEGKEVNERSRESEAFLAVESVVGRRNAEWLRDRRDFDFERAVERYGEKLETLWQHALDYGQRKPNDRAIFRFQDACEEMFDLGVKPRTRAAEILAPAAPAHNFERFEEVMTPSGVHTLLDVFPNGQVVFDDSPDVWWVHQIQHLSTNGAAA